MKRLIWLLLALILIIIGMVFFWRDKAQGFELESVLLEQTSLTLDEETIAFVDVLLNLDGEKASMDFDHQLVRNIELINRNGDDRLFTIYLDDNFNELIVYDNDIMQWYTLKNEVVTWFYMQPENVSVFDYKKVPEQIVTLNEQLVTTSNEMRWQYELADKVWHHSDYKTDDKLLFISEDDQLKIDLSSSLEPDHVLLKVFKDEHLVFEGGLVEFTPLDEGLYTYEIHSIWTGKHFKGELLSFFDVEYDLPLELEQSHDVIEQGDILTVTLTHVEDDQSLSVSQNYLAGLDFEKNGNTYQCIIPSTYYTQVGDYSVTVNADGQVYTVDFEILPRVFEIQHLTVSNKTTQSTQTTDGYAQYRAYYKKALLENVYQDQFNLKAMSFILPTTGRLTTEFGENRYVNGKKVSYNHAGIDIAIGKGTPIVATADGQVVLAMYLTVTGNSVVISHGNGIFSTYFHMDEIDTEIDQLIKQGDPVGKVGSTGFSTGAHLHFTMSYYQMNLEPGQFIYGEKITYSNYKELFKEEQ